MKVAYRLSGLELLFVSSLEHIFCPIVQKGSEEEKYASEHLDQRAIVSVSSRSNISFVESSMDDILHYTNLGSLMKKKGITHLLIRRSNDFVKAWAKKWGITLLCPNDSIAQKFENKIFFDNFLSKHRLPKPESVVVCTKDFPKPFSKTVLQIPESSGGEGTWIVSSQKEYQKILEKYSLPILARKYEHGISVGSSLFITKNSVHHSALDRQCFYKNPVTGFRDFMGIQWMPYNFFSRKIWKQIEDFLLCIGSAFQKAGIRGMVNVDYIVSKEGSVFCLECNPRLTFASNQVFSQESVNGGVDFVGLYLSRKKQKSSSVIPKNTFTGSQMLISFPLNVRFPYTVRRYRKSGFFVFKDNRLQRITIDSPLDFLCLRNGLFYYNEIQAGERYAKNMQIGTVVANFPLYSLRTGKMNAVGRKIYQYFHQ